MNGADLGLSVGASLGETLGVMVGGKLGLTVGTSLEETLDMIVGAKLAVSKSVGETLGTGREYQGGQQEAMAVELYLFPGCLRSLFQAYTSEVPLLATTMLVPDPSRSK